MGIHPAAAADGQMLERPLVSANPLDPQRRLQTLPVGIRTGQVTEIREPVVV